MGFPIRSNIFKLGTKEQRQFARYPIQAAVLFSAAAHREFADSFRELFTRLDHLTGKDVVFFALLDPPAPWLRAARGRLATKDPLYCGGYMGLDYEDDVVIREIARMFRVSWDELPALVVSPNLWLGEYCVVPTDGLRVEAQFRTLVDVVHRWGRPNLGILQEGLSGVSGAPTELHPASEWVCERLTNTYKYVEAAAEDPRKFTNQLSREVRATQQTLAVARRAVPESHGDDATGSIAAGFDALAEDAAGRLVVPATLAGKYFEAIRQKAPRRVIEQDIQFRMIELLDQESAAMLGTSLRVGNLLETMTLSGPTLGLGSIDHHEPASQLPAHEVDFAPGASGAWRALEREVNLSVIQAARRGRGVAMPERFAVVDPTLPESQAIVETGVDSDRRPCRVHLNRPDWEKKLTCQHRFLELGEARFACLALAKNPAERFDEIVSAALGGPLPAWLFDTWQSVNRIRNPGSHGNALTDREYRQVLDSVLGSGILHELIRIKIHLLGGPSRYRDATFRPMQAADQANAGGAVRTMPNIDRKAGDRIEAVLIEDPKGKGRLWARTGDGREGNILQGGSQQSTTVGAKEQRAGRPREPGRTRQARAFLLSAWQQSLTFQSLAAL